MQKQAIPKSIPQDEPWRDKKAPCALAPCRYGLCGIPGQECSREASRLGREKVHMGYGRGWRAYCVPVRVLLRACAAQRCLNPLIRHGHELRLDFIEAGGDPGRVRVFPVTMVAMTVYAAALGAREIRLVHPINDTVKAYYERFGLKYVAKGDYLYKKLVGVS